MKGAIHWAFLAGPATVVLNALVLWPLIGEFGSESSTAQLVTVLAVSSLLAPLLSAGTHMYVLRQGNGAARGRVPAVLLAGLAGLSLVGATMSLALPVASYVYAGASSAAFLVAQAALRVAQRPAQFALLTVVCQTVAVAAAGVVGSDAGLPGACAAYAISIWLCVVILVAVNARGGRPASRIDLARAFAFGLPLVPGLVLYLMIPQGSRLLVAAAGSESDLLVFQYASLLTLGGVTLVTSVSGHFGSAAMAASTPGSACLYLGQLRRAVQIVAAGLVVMIPLFVFVVAPTWLPSSLPFEEWRWVALALLLIVPLQACSDVIEYRVLIAGRTTTLLLPAVTGAVSGALTFLLAITAVPAHWAGVAAVNSAVLTRLLMLITTSEKRAKVAL